MTTIVATRNGMAADKRMSGTSMFRGTKLFRINGSIYGVAGEMQQCLKFIEWRTTQGMKPTFDKDAAITVIELTPNGELFLWESELFPTPIEEEFYAIGSGANYALGAMDMGASPRRAIKAASKWDDGTSNEIQTMNLKGK